MKVGDLVRYTGNGVFGTPDGMVGTVIEFVPATHAKEVQKIRVFQQDGNLRMWVVQYCEVVCESR